MKLSEFYRKRIIIILYLSAFGLLWFGYGLFIVPIYGYSGFTWSPNLFKIIESILIILAISWSLPAVFKRPSDFFVHLHFLLPILPMLVLYGASDYARQYMYFVVLAFAMVCMVRKLRVPKIKSASVPASVMMWFSLFAVLIYILFIISQGGFAYFNLDLRKVYDFRVAASRNLPSISGYFSPWVSNILIPYILIISIADKRWGISCLAMLGSVIMFSFTSHKSSLLLPLIASAVYFIVRSKNRMIPNLLAAYIIFIIISLFPFLVEKILSSETTPFSILAGSLGFRRGYFTPPFLNFAYYDFFSLHPYTMWAESKLTFGLVDYAYDLPSTHVIGYYFHDNVDTGANTGWLGSGYMQFGFLGMVMYAFFIGLLFAMVDLIAKSKDYRIIIAVLLIPFLGLFSSTDLPTALLTHGLLLALLLVWVIRLDKINIPRS